MGYGSIAKTLMSIISDLGEEYDITICDVKDGGVTGQEIIERDHDKFDVVINLTDEYSTPIMELCDKYKLKYLDAGFEDENSIFVKRFLEVSTRDDGNTHLFGFGMNPGIVEFMPFMIESDRPHISCVFETDLPVPTEEDKDKLYATWCPTTYYDESVVLEAFLSTENEVCRYVPRDVRYNIPLDTKSVGILYYDGTDNVKYVVNCSDHGKCCERYKHNATCYQTACGVYIGMQLLSMVPEGTSWTFTKESKYYFNEIREMLKKLDFEVDIIDNYMSKEQFEERILPLFGQDVVEQFIK